MKTLPPVSMAACLVLALALPAQSPILLKDINTSSKPNGPSAPRGYSWNLHKPWDNNRFAKMGGFIYFSADDGKLGRELYKSLPSTNAAVLVKDIYPAGSSSPSHFIVVNNILYFSAYDGKNGIEVWRSDGTAAGTYLLKDCNPGGASGNFYFPVVLGKKLYWTAKYGGNYRLWVTDGTQAGTKAILTMDRFWYYPVPFGNLIFFRGHDPVHGFEPWITDGTKAGTRMLLDVNPGAASGYVISPVEMGGRVFWTSIKGSSHVLFVTNGTAAGTIALFSNFSGGWYYPFPWGKKILFRGYQASSGFELWETDGTQAGTRMVKDLVPGRGSGFPDGMTAFKNKVYFQAYRPGSPRYALWATDGTPGGTVLVSTRTRWFGFPTVVGSTLFFRGWSISPSHGFELWKTDGTSAGTLEVKDIRPGSMSSTPSFLTELGGRLLFAADDGVHGSELWMSDGTAAGTRMIADIQGGPVGSNQGSDPRDFLDVSGLTFFTAKDAAHGNELWVTDGTPGGTRMVKDLNPGPAPGAYIYGSKMFWWRNSTRWVPSALGNTLFFQGYSPAAGFEIFKTDGTPAGTSLVKDIYPGSSSGYFYYGCVLRDRVYFFARTPGGYALWKTDGTAGGTVQVASGFNAAWFSPFPFRGKIYFSGSTTAFGREPWVTDGTPAGTLMLKDIKTGVGSGFFYEPTAMGGKVYFRANKPWTGGYDLWVTDGTKAGTRLAATLNGYSGTSLVAMGNKLFFRGQSASTGYEIWTSDGTQAGTRMLKDIGPGTFWGDFLYPCIQGKHLFFRANDRVHGAELWKTDGTPAGTVLVKDIRPGPLSSHPTYLAPLGSRWVVFQADGGTSGKEIWISDGTAQGTKRVTDIFPGSGGSDPSFFTLSGGRLVFRADDGTRGSEPWAWFPGATAKTYGFGTGSQPSFTSTDPALGGAMVMTLSRVPAGKIGLSLLCAPTHVPTKLGQGWLYFDTSRIFAALPMMPGGGSTTAVLNLPVPNSPALTGLSLASQAFLGPTTTPPMGIDFSNGLLLTFGH